MQKGMESVVMRVLDRSVTSLDLNTVGMDAPTLAQFRDAIMKAERHRAGHRADGLGQNHHAVFGAQRTEPHRRQADHDRRSRSSTTSTASCRCRSTRPSAIRLPRCLRAILRQDPDKILVGEIRDLETAEIAVQASLTGHMVFSTLHTNDAPSTITRLQRHGRAAVFDHRHGRGDPGPAAGAAGLHAMPRRVHAAARDAGRSGADAGRQLRGKTFYRGRAAKSATTPATRAASGLFELMIMNDDLRDMIMRNAQTDELRDAGPKHGMVTLRDAGMSVASKA